MTVPPNIESPNRSANAQSWRRWLWIGIILGVIAIVALLALTLLVQPESTPAFETAVDFMNAAGDGNDALASSKLSSDMQDFVSANCPDGSVSACVDAYTPPEWGGLIQAVFRRSLPTDDGGWDVLVISTYEEAQGFSGVCSYFRVEQADTVDQWEITRWAGFMSCDEPNASLTSLRDLPDAPNRAP